MALTGHELCGGHVELSLRLSYLQLVCVGLVRLVQPRGKPNDVGQDGAVILVFLRIFCATVHRMIAMPFV